MADANSQSGEVARTHTPRAGNSGMPLAVELGGTLPCVRCRYDLKGLSIRAACPECGTAVQATLLAVVDPRASELAPIRFRFATASGVVVWAMGAWLGVAASLSIQAVAAVAGTGSTTDEGNWARMLPAWLAIASAVGAVAIFMPHRGLSRQGIAAAGAGVLAYVPLVLLLAWLGQRPIGVGAPGAWLLSASGGTEALAWIAVDLLMVLICILLRPNARKLAARSLLMRTGQVDRQTLRALAFVLMLSIIGHSLGVVAARGTPALELLGVVGGLLTAVGYGFLLIGLGGVVLDCIRIAGVIAAKPLELSSMLETRLRAGFDRPSRVFAKMDQSHEAGLP